MPSTFTLEALGLNTQPNSLTAEAGSLSVAKNVIINRDNVLEPRRGFQIYGNSFGSSSDRAKQLINYKERIIRHYGDTLQFDDGNGLFTSFAGSYLETETGLRIKSIEANGNLYFTTADGIMKISAKTAADFSSAAEFIVPAGAVKALDLKATVKYNYGDQSSFFVQDSAVAYRVVWGYRDLNNNLFLGTPSQRFEVYNPLLALMLQDYEVLLGALDNIGQGGSMINDQDYVNTLSLSIDSAASTLRTNLLSLTQKIDEDIVYADNDGAPTGAPLELGTATITTGVATVTFTTGDPSQYLISGSKIFVSGFTATGGTFDGAYVVSTVNATQITFNTTATGVVTIDPSALIVSNEYRGIAQPGIPDTPATNEQLVEIQDYIVNIIARLNQEPVTVISAPLSTAYIADLDVTKASTVLLNITIPSNINDSYFYQIYRSQVFQATGTQVLATDVFPNDELQLVYEAFPSTLERAEGTITVEDIVPDAFRGANLYTNASTGEGILQSNDIPPFAKDINVFKNSVFYANTRTRNRKDFALLGVQNMITDFNNGIPPSLTIATEDGFNTYYFVLGEREEFDITTNVGATLNAAGNGSYFLVNSGNNSLKYYFWYQIGTSVDPLIAGRVGIRIVASALDTDDQIAEKTRNAFNILNDSFTATATLNVVSVTCLDAGYTDDAVDGDTGFTFNVTNQGTGEKASQETSTFTCVADVAGSLAGDYFTVNTAENQEQYYVWFKVSGVGIDPAVANKTGILVNVAINDSATAVALAIKTELDLNYSTKFVSTVAGPDVTIKNVRFGRAIDATVGTSGFTLVIDEQGELQVLLSDNISPAIAVDETANSLVRVINKNTQESVNAFYTSGAQEVPGKLLFESKDLNSPQFYIVANNQNTGDSFNPTYSPTTQISSISTGSPTTMLITTSTPHGLANLDYVILGGTNSIPSIDGYHQITLVSPTTFRINATVTTAGTRGGVISSSLAEVSSNEEASNRVYYSKTQQPESVPVLNYFDIGAKDKAILRIFPLRDSLFVLKEDGLYRISGESIPFNLALFDNSCILVAPDSVSSVDNVIYGWTRQGVSSITESGVRNVSRPLDVDLLPLSSNNYPGFKTSTWGLGYESDKSYTVFTVTAKADTYATNGYKYNSLTNSWTTIKKDYVCGVINSFDDRMYVGVGDINSIERERKQFTREDYADRQYDFEIGIGKYLNKVITLDSVLNIEPYDVFVQDQTLTIYTFNMLLRKLDIDPGINDSNYYSLLKAVPGADLRAKIMALAAKLDADTGVSATDYAATIGSKSGAITVIAAGDPAVITSTAHGLITGRKVLLAATNSVPTINGEYTATVLSANTFSVDASVINPGTSGNFSTVNADFDDLKTCYDAIITKLNVDPQVGFSNYSMIQDNTIQEILILSVDRVAKRITVAAELDYVVGPFTVYKSIDCEVIYSPNTFGGDPISLKHMRECQLLFENLAFTKGTVSFATDLLPMFEEVPFVGDGNGRFGFEDFGQGFFGGASHSAPIRTYIPRNSQRCRYMVIKFNHRVAREKWSLFGITLTGETELSSRAYK